MENIIGLKDLRQKMSHYAEKVQKGESFLVVKRSKPLFMLTPIEQDRAWESVIDFTKIKKGGVDINDILLRL